MANNATMKHLLHESGRYGVSFLCCDQEKHSMHFAGKYRQLVEVS